MLGTLENKLKLCIAQAKPVRFTCSYFLGHPSCRVLAFRAKRATILKLITLFLTGKSQENSTLMGLNDVGKVWTGTKCSVSFNIFVSVLFYEYFMLKKSLVCACQIRKVSRICHLAKKIRKSIRNPCQGENRKMQLQEQESGTRKCFILSNLHPYPAEECAAAAAHYQSLRSIVSG